MPEVSGRIWRRADFTQQNEEEEAMGRDRNTYAKRVRETKKRQKAEDKRARRLKRKEEPDVVQAAPVEEHLTESS